MLRDRIASLQVLLKTLRAQLFQEKEKLRFEIEETIHLASNNRQGTPSMHILRHPLDDYSETTLRNYETRLLQYRDNISYLPEVSSLVRIPGPHPTTYKRNIASVEKLCEVELSRMKKNISQMNTAVRRASMSTDVISSPHNPMYEFYSSIYGGVLTSSHDTGILSSDMFNYNPRRSDQNGDRINYNARIRSYPTLNSYPNVKVDCRMSTNNVCTLPSDVSGPPPGARSSTGYITQMKYSTSHDYTPEGFQGGCRGADLTFKNLANQRMYGGRPLDDDDKGEYEEEEEECEMEYSDDDDDIEEDEGED
uniref:Uncharacterized protein n=1 Tax=Timema cristinae TaxID=61476 RepID=A0A7R9HCZ3_TIMCR|nr:unnamed protein product [Timema cristinae]